MKAFISSLKKHLLTIAALSAFAFVFFTAGTLTAHAEDTEMSVYGIYLGDYGGDSTLVESRGEYLLMDLGSVNSYELIAQFLDGRGITGDTPISLYFSHLHSDHTGGFAAGNGLDRFLSDYNVQTLYVGDPQLFPETNDALQTRYDQIGSLCEAAGTEVVYLTVGSTFSFGDINTEIIGPVGLESVTNDYYNNDEGEESSSGDENLGLHNKYINNLSLIARLTCGNTVFLTTGDAEKLEEEKLCETYGEGLRADIYKLGHHGNQGSSTESFLSCVQPSWSFGLNSAKTGYFTDETSGLTYRKTYRARLHAAEYGIVYMTGDEQQAVCYRVINDSIGMYLEEDGFAVQPSGLLKLKGGIPHPQYPSGEESDVYDYSWYYLDESGNLLTGILTIDDKKYYFGEGGCREGGHYASDTGEYIAVLEHSEDHSDRRVFDENDGSMITRWYTEPGTGAQQYYDESTGIMYRGVSVIDGKEYLISEAGTLQTKTWKQFDAGNWKYYGKYGTAVTGWLSYNGEKYYLDPSTGYRVTGIRKIGSLYYLFSDGGKLQTNVWKTDDQTGGKMYFGSDGARARGWLELDGVRYYCDKTTGLRLTGIQNLGTKTYLFSDGGKLQTNVWKKDSTGKRYFGETGAMVKGWLTYEGDEYFLDKSTGYALLGVQPVGTKTYLFSSTTGKLLKNTWKIDDGGRRYFGKYGSMVTGWLTFNGDRYYLDKSTGYALTGIQKIGKKTYLLSGSGKLQTNVWKNDGTGYRYFGKYGTMVTGWLKLSGHTFYLDPSTGYRAVGKVKIDGKTYTFTKGGILKS